MNRWWKVTRELDRIRHQLEAMIGLFWEPFAQRRYDRQRSSLQTLTDGALPLQGKVAILLIYQPAGILASTLHTCRVLNAAGYSPLVVSNARLDASAVDALAAVTWRILQRPNIGYDFGGYRDAVLHLQDVAIDPDRLIVMNDSIWFPLEESETLLQRLEASALDVVGTIVHHNFRKTLLRRKATCVIESYMFLFNRKALTSKAFRTFWKTYRLSSNKYNAVHRGERRVAEVMRAGGLSADGLFSREGFLLAVGQQPDPFLRKTIQYGAYTEAELEAEAQDLLAQDAGFPGWRDHALAHIARVVARRDFHGAFVYASMQLLQIPFVKKGSANGVKRAYGALYTRMRDKYLLAMAAGDLPLALPFVLAEIRDVQRSIHAAATRGSGQSAEADGTKA